MSDELKFNITTEELRAALEYATAYGRTEHGTITLTWGEETGLGKGLGVSDKYDGKPVDITEYGAW